MTSSELELSRSQPNSSFTPFHPLKCTMVNKRKNQVSPEFAADVKRILCVFCRKKSIWQWQCDVTGCDTDGLPALRVRGIRTVRPSPPDVNRTSNGIGGFRPFSWVTRLRHHLSPGHTEVAERFCIRAIVPIPGPCCHLMLLLPVVGWSHVQAWKCSDKIPEKLFLVFQVRER